MLSLNSSSPLVLLANIQAASSSAVIVIVCISVVCALCLAGGLFFYFRKQVAEKKAIEAERERREKEAAAERKRREEEAEAERKRLEEEAAITEAVKAANEYNIESFVCSKDLDGAVPPLSTPMRMIPGEEYTPKKTYTLVVHGLADGTPQRFILTKPVISVGRVTKGNVGGADIAIKTEDKSISRVNAVLAYKYFPKEYERPSFWLLAVNQGSENNPGEEGCVRTADMLLSDGSCDTNVAFVIDSPKQKVYLNSSIYITIE